MSRVALIAEFAVLFIGLPIAYRFSPWRLPALPVLWVAAFYCSWQLRRQPGFAMASLWRPQAAPGQLISIAVCFAIGAAAIWAGVRWFAPALLFSFVRSRPGLWAAVMVLYPVLSVYPQGIVYRAFLMSRYAPLFPSRMMLVLVSGCAFAFMHLIFRNPVAVGLTLIGGLLFAWRYAATQSLFTSSLEHALYGCWLFTVGLGPYFYHGRTRLE